MRHRLAHRKLNRNPSQRKALLRGLATQLLEHGRIVTTLERAKELQSIVERAGVPTLLRERAELVFPDRKPRFELHVHADDRQTAEELLREAWAALVEADVAATPALIEECPACGANVPLDAEACPDCGLVVGRADDGGEDGPGDAP